MFEIDRSTSTAPFEQLRSQIVDAIASGSLAVGTRLPTVRALASDLHTAPGTVARAYRELEDAGVLETRGRLGTFVSPHGDAADRKLQQAAAEYAALASSLHVEGDVALEWIRRALPQP